MTLPQLKSSLLHLVSPLQITLVCQPSGSGGGNYSSPTIVDDVVYFGSVDDFIYAVDAITGIMKWKALDTTVYTSGSHTQSSPVVSNGVLYIGQSNNAISAFNINDGSLKWHLNTGSLIFSSPTKVDGTLYVGCADAKLYAVDASTGIIKCTFSSAKQIYNCPIVSNGVVYFAPELILFFFFSFISHHLAPLWQ